MGNSQTKPVVQPTSIEDLIKETKVGYIKRASEIEINATPSDIVVVMLGGSGGPDGDNPLGGSGMTNQGFKLIDLAGDSDCRIEGWVKIWDANDGNNVMIPLSSAKLIYSRNPAAAMIWASCIGTKFSINRIATLMTFSSNHYLVALCIIALSASMAGAEDGAPGHAFFKKNCGKCKKA